MKFLLIIALSILTIACTKKKEAIEYGNDKCAHCTMTISDKNWGAELISDKGKVYKFDSIECLVAFELVAMKNTKINFEQYYTVYFNNGELIDAKKAIYLRSNELHSPMGMNVASFKNHEDLKIYRKLDSATQLDYSQLVKLIQIEWEL